MAKDAKSEQRWLSALLRKTPRPLIDTARKLVVLWSPKSACTTTYIWFSSVAGFLDEVEAEQDSPHRHRRDMYMGSSRYWDALGSYAGDFHVVRIIRDPYARAVSIFRHALTTGFIDEVAARAGLDFARGVSFRKFLEFAASQRMYGNDAHLRPQRHEFEKRRGPDTVINISKEDMFAGLNALERRMGWPETDFSAISWLHTREGSRRPECELFPGDNVDDLPLARGRPPRDTRFPEYHQLLTPVTKSWVRQIYQKDFEAYSEYL